MKAILMCGLAKLRRRKISGLLLGICVLLATALLVNALILLNELDTLFDRAYEEMDGPQICALWSSELIPTDAVRSYLDSRTGITYQITENTKTVDYMEKDGTRLSNGILLELPESVDDDMLSPKTRSGGEPEMPGKNEVWITTKIANILHLAVGDNVSLQLADEAVTVRVSKIVSDPVFGSGSTNVYRMWCGYGRLSELPLAENNTVSYLELRFDEYSRQVEQDFIRDAEEHFRLPLGDTIYTYDRIKSGYTASYQMVGTLLSLVSAVLAVMIAALTLFLVRSDMDEDVRNIGIYRSLGMTGTGVVSIYLVCYGIIGLAGTALGSTLGGFFSRGIITSVHRDVGIHTVAFTESGGYQLLAGCIVLAAVMLIGFCTVFKVRGLNASYAVRTGAWPLKKPGRKKPKNTYWNGRASFELYYAVRGGKKPRYAYIAGVSLILGCLSILCLGCLNAVQNIDREPEMWGFIKTDIYVTSLENVPVSGIIPELENDPRVDYTYGANKISAQYKPDPGGTWQSIATEIYELPWNDKVKDRALEGRRPLKNDEIGVGLALARTYGLEVGESIELVVNGKRAEYTITGIFQTLSNYGNVLRMVTEDLDRFAKAGGTYGDYMLVLTNGTDKWDLAEELNEKYDGMFSFIAAKSNGENIAGVLKPAVGTILTFLFLVTLLTTINLTFILVRREQRLIGMLKALGMTSRQILKIYAWRNCLSAFAGNTLGLLLGIFVIPDLLTPYARVLGITEFPFVNSPAGTAVSFVLLPICMFLGTTAIIKAIGTVSVKQLVSE